MRKHLKLIATTMVALLFICILCMFITLPSKLEEYKVNNIEAINKYTEDSYSYEPKGDYFIQINDSRVIVRSETGKIDTYNIDSITQWKDVHNIRWSNRNIIIVMEDLNTILIETSVFIKKYDVARRY